MDDDMIENHIAAVPRYTSRKEAMRLLGVGNTKLHALLNRGAITAKKLDGKTIISVNSIEAFLNSLPDVRS